MAVEQAAGTTEMMRELIGYITEKVIKGKNEINEDTPLVSSGLVDSFALIEIFLELQKIAGRKVPASKVQAKDMDSVRLKFAMVDTFGKPAKTSAPSRRKGKIEIAQLKQLTSAHCSFCDMLCGCNEVNLDC